MQYNKLLLGIFAIATMFTSQASAQLLFDFDNDSPFDTNQGIGASQMATLEDGMPAETVVNVSTVDLFAPEFEDDGNGVFTRTGNTLFASADGGVTTQTNSNSLGINNPSISDDGFFDGAGIENRDFNDGEGWVISFDQDVSFTNIDFSSLDDGSVTVTIPDIGTFTIVDLEVEGDNFDDPFGVDFIPAGTPITIEFSSPDALSANLRINGFTVTTEERVILGDVNRSGVVNFLDIAPFIMLLSAGGSDQAEADINGDEIINFLDIAPFITLLAGGGSSA